LNKKARLFLAISQLFSLFFNYFLRLSGKLGGKHPDEKTLKEAAVIAAYYSAARFDGKVPVDYTLVKNVKKPSGSLPGMVIYTDYRTIIVSPDEDLVEKLRAGT